MKPNLAYFRLCLGIFIVACCVGVDFAFSYVSLAHGNDWAAWRPGVGIGLLLLSMVMSFVGYARSVRRRDVLAAKA